MPPETLGKWKYFVRQLSHLCNLEIPCWLIGLTEESIVTLDVFCDASAFAYDAVAYITIQLANTTSLVIVKSRVVPCTAQMWSIPRKELISIIEGMHIVLLTREALALNITTIYMWTDSMTVLSWVTNDAAKPNRYVRRKLDELEKLKRTFAQVYYRHAPSEFNPTDVASCSIDLLSDGKHRVRLWLHGPHFLCHQECWPKNPNIKVYTDVPLVALQDDIPPPVHTSEVVGVSSMPLKQDENTISKITLTLMAEVIHKHSMLQALCRDIATLTVFAEYMFICREEKIYADCPDWENQKFRVKNKVIKLRDGNITLKCIKRN